MLVRYMPKILSVDENTLLNTHPYDFNSPPEKIDLGKENPEPHPLRYCLRNGDLNGTRTRINPKNETDRHHLTPGHERPWTLYRND